MASVYERMASQSSPSRIGRNVIKLVLKILSIANAVFVESCLPDLAAKLSTQAVRKTALDTLGAMLNSLAGRGR